MAHRQFRIEPTAFMIVGKYERDPTRSNPEIKNSICHDLQRRKLKQLNMLSKGL